MAEYFPNEESEDGFFERNKGRLDLRNFLTQRSIQSFTYLLKQCREEHTIQFLEKTLEFTNIEKYHGTAAFNMTLYPRWDSFFFENVDRPAEILVMAIKQRRRRRSSLSGHNAYLEGMSGSPASSSVAPKQEPQQQQPKPSTPKRGVGGSYLDNLSAGSSDEAPKMEKKDYSIGNNNSAPKGSAGNYLGALSSNIQQSSNEVPKVPMQDLPSRNPYVEERMVEYEFEVDPSAIVRRILAVREQVANEWTQDCDTLMSLNDEILEAYDEYTEQQANAEEEEDEGTTMEDSAPGDELDSLVKDLMATNVAKEPIFDINAWYTWSQSLFSQDRDSSPFRKKNFDLLLLLSTQESVHRVLKNYRNGAVPELYEWLLDFYKNRIRTTFDGHQNFGRAEEFLAEMLRSSPVMIERGTDVALIKPAQIAEDIVRERSEVALEWMQIAKMTQDEHTDLRRLLFSNMVSKAKPEPSLADTIIEEESMNNQGNLALNSTAGIFE
ncbi:MAG: hypothetical protein SGILL_009690 [Bacillariaceae sp.]